LMTRPVTVKTAAAGLVVFPSFTFASVWLFLSNSWMADDFRIEVQPTTCSIEWNTGGPCQSQM
jgi:hypothetical protein